MILPESAYSTIGAREAMKNIDAGEYDAIIDVRSQNAWSKARIANAVNIPFALFRQPEAQAIIESAFPDHHANILVYCYIGVASKKACAQLAAWGYDHVENLKGGHTRWRFY